IQALELAQPLGGVAAADIGRRLRRDERIPGLVDLRLALLHQAETLLEGGALVLQHGLPAGDLLPQRGKLLALGQISTAELILSPAQRRAVGLGRLARLGELPFADLQRREPLDELFTVAL